MNGLICLTTSVRTWAAGEDEEGQGLVEYALILALVAMLLVSALTVLGNQLVTTFENIGNSIP